jgi:hypothetical protein
VLFKRVSVLVGAVMMVLSIFAASAPVFAQGEGGSDPNPGFTEGSNAPTSTPPQGKPGTIHRDSSANDHDTGDQRTGFGKRVDEQQG